VNDFPNLPGGHRIKLASDAKQHHVRGEGHVSGADGAIQNND
jgi:hypothetical protein